MLKKIYKIASSAILTIVLFSSIMFIGSTSAYAIENLKLNESFAAVNIDEEQSVQSVETSEQENNLTYQESESDSRYPDLGDDQVFPFVAGLDSYEGS